jgi:cysteine desulfurase
VLPGAVAGVREKLGAPAPVAEVRNSDEQVLVVDALGRRCPIPVIELAKVIGDVPVGGTVRVLSDDEAARLDIPAWCAMRGQEYVGEEPADHGTAYVVRRVS